MYEVVSQARSSFADGDYFWNARLLQALDALRPGSACAWVERCARILIPLVTDNEAETFLKQIEDLADLCARNPSQLEFEKLAEEIYFGGDRTPVRLAVSHLWSARVPEMQ